MANIVFLLTSMRSIGRVLAPLVLTLLWSRSVAAQSTQDLKYHGGPLQLNQQVFTIFWGYPIPQDRPTDSSFPPGYQAAINAFIQRLGGSSYYAIATQYGDGSSYIGRELILGGTWEDRATPFPQVPGGQPSEADIRAEVHRAILQNNWPDETNGLFLVFTPIGVFRDGRCEEHYPGSRSVGHVPFPRSTCTWPFEPNANVETAIVDTANVIFQSALNPAGTGWFRDPAGVTGPCQSEDASNVADVVLAGVLYRLQKQWSNWNSQCVAAFPPRNVIVLTHGFQKGRFFDETESYLPDLEHALNQRLQSEQLANDTWLLVYRWPQAFKPAWVDYLDAFNGTLVAGFTLANQLLDKIDVVRAHLPDYDPMIHFIGHSLGTMVNAHAVHELIHAGTRSTTIEQFTILDDPLLAGPEFFYRTIDRRLNGGVENMYSNCGATFVGCLIEQEGPRFGQPIPGAFPCDGDICEGRQAPAITTHSAIHSEYYAGIVGDDRWVSPILPTWIPPKRWNPQPVPFTDATLTESLSPIRAVHIQELRTRIDQARQRALLSSYNWTDPSLLAGDTLVKAQHLHDLRAALAQVYVAEGREPPAYDDPSLGPATRIRAIHILQLRAAIIRIE